MLYRYTSLSVFLLIVIIAAFFGSMFEAGEWYHHIVKKPWWNPPPWIFGPVWAVLYLLIALAAWKVWLTGHYSRTGALMWWLIQLALNTVWSWLFFGLHRPGWAWLELAVLIGAVVLCIRAFHQISKPAANLMIPYLLWLIFAWFLNLAIWTMNGGLFSSVLLS